MTLRTQFGYFIPILKLKPVNLVASFSLVNRVVIPILIGTPIFQLHTVYVKLEFAYIVPSSFTQGHGKNNNNLEDDLMPCCFKSWSIYDVFAICIYIMLNTRFGRSIEVTLLGS